MPKWEYLEFETEYYQVDRIKGKTQSEKKFIWQFLDQIGTEGWEVVAMLYDNEHHRRVYLAKRELLSISPE
ncbi:MAG: hypothetical protein GYA15_15355 [Leptolinea sp.]|jgi:hypothetical protein|nr:hypothetical protein [Leptolinea sp.]